MRRPIFFLLYMYIGISKVSWNLSVNAIIDVLVTLPLETRDW